MRIDSTARKTLAATLIILLSGYPTSGWSASPMRGASLVRGPGAAFTDTSVRPVCLLAEVSDKGVPAALADCPERQTSVRPVLRPEDWLAPR